MTITVAVAVAVAMTMAEAAGRTDQAVERFALTLDRSHSPSIELAPLGGKGAALARLISHGIPVPPTGIVTTAAYHSVAQANPRLQAMVDRIDAGEVVEESEVTATFAAAHVPQPVADALRQMAIAVADGGPIAVRSSATVEDLSGSSFAGQYRSLLNIDSSDANATLDAVREVWASLWFPAPSAYRRAFGIETVDVAMAVVVMAMIPATTAGVVFTVDPGGTDGARVEAVEGLGESLVSGERTPSAWVVPHDLTDPARPVLPPAAARALELSLEIEDAFGVPQDVEWAACDEEVSIVQARPITVLAEDDGFDTPVDDHELTSAGIAELVPGVLSPLLWELNSTMLEEAFRSVLDSLGIIQGSQAEDRPFIRRVRGRAAVDFDQLRSAASAIAGAVEELELQYFGEIVSQPRHDDLDSPPSRRQRFQKDMRTARTRRRAIDDADVLISAVAELRSRRPDLTKPGAGELLAYHRRLLDLAARGLIGELGVAAAGGAAYDRLVSMLDSYLGEGQGSGAAQSVTAKAGAQIDHDLDASAAVFAGPTWADLGAPAMAEESVCTAGGTDTSYKPDLRALIDRLRAQPGWTRRRVMTGQFVDIRAHLVRRTVVDVVEQFRRREASKAAFLELGGEARRVHLEMGQRLVAAGILDAPASVELFSTGELQQALHGSLELSTDVLRRRQNWLGRYDVEGPLPVRFRGTPDREPKPLPHGDQLTGWAASPGRGRARARVITGPNEHFESGEVLVAQATDASWSPLFVRAAAVVVERGGPLSHAAILARELGLPAVLNVDGATRILDGLMVSVDGDEGIVVIEGET